MSCCHGYTTRLKKYMANHGVRCSSTCNVRCQKYSKKISGRDVSEQGAATCSGVLRRWCETETAASELSARQHACIRMMGLKISRTSVVGINGPAATLPAPASHHWHCDNACTHTVQSRSIHKRKCIVARTACSFASALTPPQHALDSALALLPAQQDCAASSTLCHHTPA